VKRFPWIKTALAIFLGLSATWLFVQVCSSFPVWWHRIWQILLPITFGAAIAYLLLSPVRFLERTAARTFPKASQRLCTSIAVMTVFSAIVVGLTLIAVLWLPSLVRNALELAEGLPGYAATAQNWLDSQLQDSGFLSNPGVQDFIQDQIDLLAANLQAWLQTAVTAILSGMWNTLMYIGKLVLGFIAALYLLLERRALHDLFVYLLRNLIGEHRLSLVQSYLREVDQIFGRFLAARLTESFVVFLIAWVGFAALRLPYAVLLAVLTGVLNLIPYFGAFAAYLIVLIVTLLSAPALAIWVTVLIIALQLVDGWVIAPVLFGERLKLSGFMVILALTIFGGCFGLMGMTIGVPCFALLLVAIQRVAASVAQKRQKEKKDIPAT